MHETTARADYEVIMPGREPMEMFHLVKHADRPREQDFKSRAARGGPRLWPDEDAADYYAISCYDDLEVARQNGRGTGWAGVATLVVDGHRGHVYADTYEAHHFSVWGEPSALLEAVTNVASVD